MFIFELSKSRMKCIFYLKKNDFVHDKYILWLVYYCMLYSECNCVESCNHKFETVNLYQRTPGKKDKSS